MASGTRLRVRSTKRVLASAAINRPATLAPRAAPSPPSSAPRITFRMTSALSRHSRRVGTGAKRARLGCYLMSPLGSRAGRSPRGPLHARGAGLPALRHEPSSSFLPAGSASSPRPGGAVAPGAGRAALSQPRRCGGEGRRGGGREEKRPSRGRETSCALPPSRLTPPRGHPAAGQKPPFPRRRPPLRPAPGREVEPTSPAATRRRVRGRRSSRRPRGNRRPARPRRPTGSGSVALTGPSPGRCRGVPPSAAAPPPPSPGRSPASPSFWGGGSLGPSPPTERAGQGREQPASLEGAPALLGAPRSAPGGGQRPGPAAASRCAGA